MMSETTSSPSVHLHPVSPSSESSLSSADSAPRSEPTSDEQPDLGAFTAVLREWTHLQPFPRIPVQVRSATSSTTPTFQPDQSVVGSEYNVGRSRRRNSRTSQRSGLSTLSSFTRPASSSAQPEGSTVWNQAPIASYLNSATPSNDMITEEDGESGLREGDYTPSPPASRPSTALTVEIASEVDFPSFDGSRDSSRNQLDSSPYSYHMDPDISLPVPLKTYGQRLDSRETAHRDEELEDASLHLNGSHGQNTSLTSRDFVRQEGPYSETSSLQSHSRYQSQAELTSIQLQSQAHPPSTIATSSSESLSFPVQNPTSSTFLPSNLSLHVPQRHNLHSNNGSGSGNSSTSTSTMITALLNRSRNPLQRATSDSSTVTTDSVLSSDFSLISYQIPETPSIINDEEVDPDQNITQGLTVAQSQLTRPPAVPNQFPSSSTSLPSTSAASGSLSLKTQKSIDSSTSSSHTDFPAFAEQAQPTLLQPFRVSGASHLSSFSSNGSPLPNPYSPIPPQRRVMSGETSSAPLSLDDNVGGPTVVREFDIVNDLGTPGEQVSELELFQVLDRATRTDLLPVDDIEEEEFSEVRHDQLKQARAGLQATRRHAPAYEGEGPSSSRGRPAQKQLVSKQIPHVELQLDDDADGDNDEDYPYRYPYSHTPVPQLRLFNEHSNVLAYPFPNKMCTYTIRIIYI
ncbi:hypothetical protein CPB84DRAFT_205630 [Gymnopilus junonius]|uniref:Uncharacterized protein n=1 Tax=Gymnopilus junonius TaxID=109634 RepID=A0A9P5NVK3_GYMJU|nr:hypothetical protein CPB84DRAFT_205630 [Gymnopilus junonius]